MIPPRVRASLGLAGSILLALAVTATASRAAPVAAPLPVGEDGRAEYTVVRLLGVGPEAFRELQRAGLIVERDGRGEVIAYLGDEGLRKVRAMGLGVEVLPDPGLEALRRAAEAGAPDAPSYHDHQALTDRLQQVAAEHPEITRLVSAGDSVEGRELWWLRITDHPDAEEDEPGFKYVATMHGDEPPGTELCLYLIDELTDGYGSDPRTTRLVDEVEIWIMPMLNPDGNARAQRTNANGYDLNRNFPDRIDDPVDDPAGRQPETAVMMSWQDGHATVLSANFHSGALVTNYPYDNNESHSNVYTATPDDDIFRELALEYSEDNPPMYGGAFDQGITNGADWYTISGGMQDWNYVWRGDMEVTVELEDVKWPPAGELDRLWSENRESMISYLERALTGVRGLVTDGETGAPLAARLTVAGRDVPFFTDPEVGDYHRPLPAGGHTLVVSAPGYETREVPITVDDSEADAVRADVALSPRPTSLEHVAQRVTEDGGGDGFLDPGESGRLAVTLRNDGRGASGIAGPLLPLTAHGTSEGEGGWPDLGPGESAESLDPHLAVGVAPDAPAGHQLGFAVEYRTAEGARGRTEAFFVPLGAPEQERTPAADVPRAIEDHATIQSHVDIAADRLLDEVNVRVDIAHTYIGDLVVTLVAPDGGTYRLHERTGGSADDIRTWYDTETQPVDSLDPLAGSSSQGRWTLRVEDRAGGDQGTLEGWTLEQLTRPFEDPVAEVLLRRVSRPDPETVRIEWWPVGTAESYRVYRSAQVSSADGFDDVTGEDGDPTDTAFEDGSSLSPVTYWLVTAVGHTGEGLWGHYGR
jgi:carboxypeptidase D